MTAKDLLKQQYGFFYLTAKANLEGMTAEESLVQPAAGNCANWIVGHVVGAHNAVMRLVDASPVWDSPTLSRTQSWSDPITSPEEALDWDTMVARLLASEAPFMEALESLDEAAFDQGGFTDPFGNSATRGAMLNLLAVHQNYHAGQLAMARRLAGHEGAIRGPKPPDART